MYPAKFIDTHAHSYLEHFNEDREDMIQRARTAGLQAILLPGIDSSSYDSLIELSDANPDFFYSMIGLHPTSVKENYKDELEFVEKKLKERNFIAIGEIGIDLYWDKTFLKEQMDAFSIQIDWADTFDLPFIIHARDSFKEVFEVLDSKKRKFLGVFHAFSGSVEIAQKAIGLGFKLGIGGVLTYKKSGLAEVVQQIGLEHLVLETDSPYLPPVPHRGQRNESAYIIHTAQKLADIYGAKLEEVARITTENAQQVFKRLPKED